MAKNKQEIHIDRVTPTISVGLSAQQVVDRNALGLNNKDKSKASKSYAEIVVKNVFTFFNILCFAIAIVLLSLGEIGQCFFILIITANMLIGIIQEIRSKIMVEKLSLVSAPTATLVRDGENVQLKTSEIVIDDVCMYETGKQISCDGVVLSGTLYVNESLLTGESVDVKKSTGDRVYAGSFVTSGNAYVHCDKVGKDNYISELAMRAKKLKKTQSPILKTLNRIIKYISFGLIPIAALVGVKCYFFDPTTQGNLSETIQRMAGATIGLIPSGMFLLTSVALAVGIIKLAMNKTLVQDLYCIEMLARCNVLCLDKTGTITDGTMKVNKVETLASINAKDIISSLIAATKDNNSTAQALVEEFSCNAVIAAREAMPFSSATKLSAAELDDGYTYILGAAEFVTNKATKEVKDKIFKYSEDGYRVLMLARTKNKISELENKDAEPVAIIVIEDHIRAEAIDTINWFKQNNVEIKIISGDNPVTVSNIARRVGVENADKYINLDGMSENDVIDAANKFTVFGRVTPEQKALLVSSMKHAGSTVAMTGDGVNDILAFKEADCSVAMASGSDATKNVASLVLMDSNFANMPKVVAEGRRVVNNIQQSASVYLMKTLFVALAIFVTLGSYPFNTKQLMVLEFFVIGIPTFFLALQPNNKLISGNFLAMLLKRAIPSGIILILNFSAMWIAGSIMSVPSEQLLTMQVLSISLAGLVMLMLICFPYNAYRTVLVCAMTVLTALFIILFPTYLELVNLELWQGLAVALSVSLSFPVGALLHYLVGLINVVPLSQRKK